MRTHPTKKPTVHPTKKAVKKKAKPRVKPKPAAPKIGTSTSVKPVGIVRASTRTATGGSTGTAYLLIVSSLVLAIICFGIASLPPALLPNRTAYFVSVRQPKLMATGLALCVATAFTFFLTRGP